MADVLKATLWWSSNPTFALTNNSDATASEGRVITAAEAHDSSDATYEGLNIGGDTVSLEGDANLRASHALTACPAGGIKFVRVKFRARVLVTAGTGSAIGQVTPRISGVNRGAAQALDGTFTNYQQDFTTDPADGQPWTKAKVDAATWGVDLFAQTSDPGVYATSAQLRMAEMTVEVWGEDVTSVAAGASATGEANAPEAMGGTLAPTTDERDPTVITAQATVLDQTSGIVTVRSFKASLNDQSTATKDIFTSPASWPNSGTQLQPLYGSGSQGLQGSSGAGNGINGIGLISGVKLVAIVRASKRGPTSSLTTCRFGTAMGVKSLLAQPTVNDLDALTEAMWERVETTLVTTGQFGNAFTWGNGPDSVWASLFGWTFNHTYSNTANPDTTQLEVAEAWVEVHGPVGSEPEVIELVQVFGDSRKKFVMATEV